MNFLLLLLMGSIVSVTLTLITVKALNLSPGMAFCIGASYGIVVSLGLARLMGYD